VLKILYIGNNPDAIIAFRKLENEFDFHQLANGLKAVSYLKEGNIPDAIVCEARLQGMNGIAVGKLIRGIEGFAKTPFILFLFEKDDKFTETAFVERRIVDDVYQFPIDLDRLFVRIEYLLRFYKVLKSDKKPKSAFRDYKIPFVKRAFDVVTSSIALILLSPLLIIVAIAIRLESNGAPVYKSKRVGTNYKIFDFLKFRSMYIGADKHLLDLKHLNQYNDDNTEGNDEFSYDCPECNKLSEGKHCSPVLYIGGNMICEYWYIEQKKKNDSAAFIKIKDDPRVSKIGNFIRNTSIDELPQLFNVLKGDMSIVGNRPLPLYEAELLTSDDWSARFLGPAGITGLWQVELRGKKGAMSNDERKALDNKYAETYSFWGDIMLILRTIPVLLQKENV
jgi:lipopolysaccharide/colanic/teichoic acid biosynthesis glycosyltransferase